MQPPLRLPLADGREAHVGWTGRPDSDLAPAAASAVVEARRRAVVDLPWVWLAQEHGSTVEVVTEMEDVGTVCGRPGDALVTAVPGVVVSVTTADCAPVALVGGNGVVAAVHAGWRGLCAGVIEHAVERMRQLGSSDVVGVLGPCIHPECYLFGPAELGLLVARYGPAVRGTTATGRAALDVPTAVAAALGRAGVPLVASADRCTACDRAGSFSHRARGDAGRQALVVWTDPTP